MEGSGSSQAKSSFEQLDTKLPSESPDLNTSSQLQWNALGRDESRSTTAPPVYWLTSSVFKPTLILDYVMTMVDAIISHINPSGYSYWSSDLNETTRIAPSSNHVPTVLPSVLKVRWYPDCLLEYHFWYRRTLKPGVPLYTTFVVYLTTIDGQYLKTKNYQFIRKGRKFL